MNYLLENPLSIFVFFFILFTQDIKENKTHLAMAFSKSYKIIRAYEKGRMIGQKFQGDTSRKAFLKMIMISHLITHFLNYCNIIRIMCAMDFFSYVNECQKLN